MWNFVFLLRSFLAPLLAGSLENTSEADARGTMDPDG